MRLPHPVAIHFVGGAWFAVGKQIGAILFARFNRSSRINNAKSFCKIPALYLGWRTMAETFTIWKGKGSSSIPNFHSPPLINTSLVAILNLKRCLLAQRRYFKLQTYPSTQWAAVRTTFRLTITPPHNKLRFELRKTIACHGISAKFTSIGPFP